MKHLKHILILIVVVAIVAGLAFLVRSCTADKTATTPPAQASASVPPVMHLEAMIVHPSMLEENIEVSGVLQAFDETVLASELSGRVTTLNLPEGQSVRQGTLLMKLYDGDLQAQLKKLLVQERIQQTTISRQKELLNINGISQQEYDLNTLQLSNIQADIELLRSQISKTELRAPYDGKIGLKKISLGAFVTAGQAIATLRAEQSLKLDFSVPEKYATLLTIGKTLSFTISGDTNVHHATVMANEQSIEAATHNLKVRALVNEQSSTLVPGAFAKVLLSLGKNDHALMVPTQALIPMARNKKIILCKNGKAVFSVIQTGVRQPDQIEVLSGVSAGDTVVTTGLLFIRPDAPLKFEKIAP